MPLRFDLTKLGDEHCDVRALAFDRSGARLVTGGAAAVVFALGETRVERAVELNLFALDRNTSAMVEAIEFSPDGGTVAARFGGHSGSNGFVETWLYDAGDGALWHVYGGTGPDGGGEPGTGPAGDAQRGAGRALAFEYFAGGLVHGQLWTPGGSRRVARAPAREPVVRVPATGREFLLRAPLPFRPLAFAPGGTRLVAFSGPADGADDTVLCNRWVKTRS